MTTPEPVATDVIEVLRETIKRHTPDAYHARGAG